MFGRIPDLAVGGEGEGDIYVVAGEYAEGAVYQFALDGEYLQESPGTSPSEPFPGATSVAIDPKSRVLYVGVKRAVDVSVRVS